MKISRRAMLSGGGLLIFAGFAMPEALRSGRASARGFPFMLSDEQWRKRLSTLLASIQYPRQRRHGAADVA